MTVKPLKFVVWRLSNSPHRPFAYRITLLLVLLLAACGQPNTEITPTAGFAPSGPDSLTPTPIRWVEGASPITLDNVEQIAYLGRLDAPGTPSTVFAYALSPDSTRLIGLNNDLILGWNLLTGDLLFQTSRGDSARVFYSPDKTEFYTLTIGGNLAAYDAETGVFKTQFTTFENYNGITTYDSENGWLALGGLDGTVQVWDLLGRQMLAALDAHDLSISALAFNQNGTWLASGSGGGKITIWEWQTSMPVVNITMGANRTPLRLAFAPDNAQLASVTVNEMQLWSTADGSLKHALDIGPGGATELSLYSPDGRFLVNGGNVPTMIVWNPADGSVLNVLPGVGGDRTSAAFSPGSDLLVTAVLGKPVALWDTTYFGDESLQQASLPLASNTIFSLAWTSDGYLIILFDATGPIHVWGIAPPG
ncbi:MAG: hypothetical protein H6672_02620 [Anaerolineaceae bacterium]|nr:hypothetical protein [Anaerolineaceae bacterium]